MLDQSTLFAEGSPVSPGVSPDNKKGQTITATSGRKCAELLPMLSLDGSLERMSLALFQTPWASTAVSLIWRHSVTASNRSLFRLVPLTPRTDETVSGFWHTPTAHMVKEGGYPAEYTRKTPTLSAEANAGSPARLWPTPNASDNRDSGNLSMPSIQRRQKIGKQLTLSMVADPNSGSLNPQWVEWLMGFPEGWTDLEHSETPSSPKSPK